MHDIFVLGYGELGSFYDFTAFCTLEELLYLNDFSLNFRGENVFSLKNTQTAKGFLWKNLAKDFARGAGIAGHRIPGNLLRHLLCIFCKQIH